MIGHGTPLRIVVAAGVFAALLAIPATPAHAQPDQVTLDGVDSIAVQVGGAAQSVRLRVQNNGEEPAQDVGVTMTLRAELVNIGVYIASVPPGCNPSNNDTRMDCKIPLLAPGPWSELVQIGVHGNSSVQAGEQRGGMVDVSLAGIGYQGNTNFNVTVRGPERAPAVTEVSGFVTDIQTGERIGGARVLLVDSEGADFTTTTNENGDFQFIDQQIAPGQLALRASMDGYEGQESVQSAQAEQRLTGIQLTLTSTASPTPSASASPTASADPATASPTPAVVDDEDDASGGLTFFTTVMIIFGIVLVLLGAGAIAYLIYRRRKERAEDDDDEGFADVDPTSGPPRGPTPGSHGVYRPSPTQALGSGGGAPTMIARKPGLADGTALAPRAGMGDETTLLPPATGAGDETTLLAPVSGPGDETTHLRSRSGASDETTVLPRADDPPGPRPPVPGAPPPPRSAAPTYGGGYGNRPARPEASGGPTRPRSTVARPGGRPPGIGRTPTGPTPTGRTRTPGPAPTAGPARAPAIRYRADPAARTGTTDRVTAVTTDRAMTGQVMTPRVTTSRATTSRATGQRGRTGPATPLPAAPTPPWSGGSRVTHRAAACPPPADPPPPTRAMPSPATARPANRRRRASRVTARPDPASANPVMSRPGMNGPATSRRVTSRPAMTSPAMSSPATTSQVTTSPATTSPATTSQVMTGEGSSRPVTVARASARPARRAPTTAGTDRLVTVTS